MNITEKTGKLFSVKGVIDTDHLMIITKNGTAIRLAVKNLRLLGRTTQGVRLINLRDSDEIASITYIETNDDEETNGNESNGKIIDDETELETIIDDEEEIDEVVDDEDEQEIDENEENN